MSSDRKSGPLIAVVAAPVAAIGLVMSLLLVGGSSDEAGAGACIPAAGGASGPVPVPDPTTSSSGIIQVPDEIAGYKSDQLYNAAQIIKAAQDLGLSPRDQTIGVMTAMGESSLTVLDYGDGAGPDSRGLFQQRDNGAWGSYEDRMDPYISSTNFFNAMVKKVPERDGVEPTIVAHRTQVNADPYHYVKYWDPAVAVVEGLSGVDTGLLPSTGGQVCSGVPATPGTVSATGWANPGGGPLVSNYGMRYHPILKEWRLHAGVDLHAGGCDGPIWAAQDGVVTFRGFDTVGNGTITIDHGGGVQTSYLHMYENGLLVNVGDQVKAGDHIARTGSSGRSTGCHLHFEVIVDGTQVDPVPYMTGVGITLG